MLENSRRIDEVSSEQSNDQEGSLNMSNSKNEGPKSPSTPNWEDVDLSIIDESEIDAFSGERKFSDAHEYGIMLSELMVSHQGTEDYLRALEMLRELMRIRVSIDVPNTRFEPYCILNGRRTSAIEDFRGKAVDEIVSYADRTSHLVVRARLKHIAWHLERNRKGVGTNALDAYIELLDDFDIKECCSSNKKNSLSDTKYEIICMAYCVLRGLGYPERQKMSLTSVASKIFRESCKAGDIGAIQGFVELSLACDLIEREYSVNCLKRLISSGKSDTSSSVVADLWTLCARVYQSIDKATEAHKCQIKAAEIYTEISEYFESKGDYTLSVHWTECAIMAYRGVSDVSEKRKILRKKLADMQEKMLEQLETVRTPLDVSKLVENAKRIFDDADLYESLRMFTAIVKIPTSEEVIKQSTELNRDHPLFSIADHKRLNEEGKTVARSSNLDQNSIGQDSGFNFADSLCDSVHRIGSAYGSIDVARAIIDNRYCISVNFIYHLLGYSLVVPNYLRQTLSVGFERYFAGDMVCAAYILTPLLEGLFRHVLRLHDCCVTRFDESNGTQENLSLSGLLNGMRHDLDVIFGSNYVKEVSKVFVERHGPCLRNRVVHAEMHDEQAYGHDAIYGCYLIWLLAIAPLLQDWDRISSELRKHYPGR